MTSHSVRLQPGNILSHTDRHRSHRAILRTDILHTDILHTDILQTDIFRSQADPATNRGEQRPVMSFREFEQLPPFSEDCAELPALWEDGGGVGPGEGVFEAAQWTSLSEGGVRLLVRGDSGDGGSDSGSRTRPSREGGRTLEERNALIEQTLSQIYQSPFQQLTYASSPPAHSSQQYRSTHGSEPSSAPASDHAHPSPASNHAHLSTQANHVHLVPPSDHAHLGPESNHAHSSASNHAHSSLPSDHAHLSPLSNHAHFSSVPNHAHLSVAWAPSRTAQGGDSDEDIADNREEEEERSLDVQEGEKGKGEGVRDDTHNIMKASIARAAQRAVSGYRTCRDADSYVGTQAKPTLILARAPPSPSGILRRTNKKAATVRVAHGTVTWADGRPTSLPPDDAT